MPDGQPHSNDLNPQRDIRCVVASVLEKLGYTRLNYLKDRSFSDANSDNEHPTMADSSQLPDLITRSLQVTPNDLALTTADKQVMVVVKRYAVLRYVPAPKHNQEGKESITKDRRSHAHVAVAFLALSAKEKGGRRYKTILQGLALSPSPRTHKSSTRS